MTPLSPNDLTEPEPWDPPKPWWRRRTGVTAMAAAIALVGGGLYFGLRPASTSCGTGVARVGPDHVCVGLTDGSGHFSFTADLQKVSTKIATENSQIKGGPDPWVSVVYLLPMTPSPGGSTTIDSVRHELEGAYTAQWEANHTNEHGDIPKVRLLLANPGTGWGQPDPVTGLDPQQAYMMGQIKAHIATDHIVAVAGLGTSTTYTMNAINAIIGDNLAAFGSVITADGFTPKSGYGLARVAPPNSDETAAAAVYLRSVLKDPSDDKVQLVVDTNSIDDYTKTLAEKFRSSYPDVLQQTMEYNSSQDGVATNLNNQMANLCAAKPAAVYFAGRGIELPKLLGPLAQRPCPKEPLIVMAGDDASQLAQSAGKGEVEQDLKAGNIRLLFTGLAHPGAWDLPTHAYSKAAFQQLVPGGEFLGDFQGEQLTDGQAIMGHDAMLAAYMAARDAVSSNTPAAKVTGSDVIQMLPTLYGSKAIAGASGLISLNDQGYPDDKAIPIVEFGQDGSVTAKAVSSKDGQPPQFQQ